MDLHNRAVRPLVPSVHLHTRFNCITELRKLSNDLFHHTGFAHMCHLLNHTDCLADRVGIVGDLQMREMLADLLGHLLWSETHGGDVVGTQGQLALWGLHELYRGTVAVRDMHHGKTCVGAQVALMVTCAESIVEDLNSVVCEESGTECLVTFCRGFCLISVIQTGMQFMQYLLFLLQGLYWPISHLGTVGSGNLDRIYDGDTKEMDNENIEMPENHAKTKKVLKCTSCTTCTCIVCFL